MYIHERVEIMWSEQLYEIEIGMIKRLANLSSLDP